MNSVRNVADPMYSEPKCRTNSDAPLVAIDTSRRQTSQKKKRPTWVLTQIQDTENGDSAYVSAVDDDHCACALLFVYKMTLHITIHVPVSCL